MKYGPGRNRKGQWCLTETSSYKMTKHHGFDAVSWQAFSEAALEKYAECKQGEKMTFGKCQKVGGGKQVPESLSKSKSAAQAQLATAKKMGNKSKIAQAQKKLDSVNAKINAFNASEGGDHLDFGRCQRPDGSYYGTSGECRKGTPTGAKEKEPKKARAKSGGGGDDGGETGKSGGGYSPNGVQDAAHQKSIDANKALSKSVSDKEMNTLLTGGPRTTKQEFQTMDRISNPSSSQGKSYAKINERIRKDAKELIENEGKYKDLVAKVRAGNASEAEKAKYSKMFGWPHTDKTVDRTMANVAKINAQRSGGGAKASKPAPKSGGAATKPKPKAAAAPKKPKGGGTYSGGDMKKLDNAALREEKTRLTKVSKGKSAAKYDAYESLDKINAEMKARGMF